METKYRYFYGYFLTDKELDELEEVCQKVLDKCRKEEYNKENKERG